MWGDEKFRSLSPMQPCGQGLWIYLLTGSHTGPIPGLFRAGRAALAEDLEWTQEAFDKAFQEIFALGMAKADWKARVVWIQNAIKCNPPQSPNVVTSWGGEWQLIPECALKGEAYQVLKSCAYECGESFREAFDKALPKPFAKTMPNQEQEQEQEQETISPPALTRKLVKQKSPDPIVLKIYEKYPRKVARRAAYEAINKAIGRVAKEKSCSREDAADFIYQAVAEFRESPAGKKGEHTPHPATFMNQDKFFDHRGEWWRVNTNGNSSESNGQDVIGDVAARLAQEIA